MSKVGFRLFAVKLHKGKDNHPHPIDDCEGMHLSQVLEAALSDLAGTRPADPKAPKPGSADGHLGLGQTEAFLILTPTFMSGAVFIPFRVGKTGDHDYALGVGVSDVDLDKRAPTRKYRAILGFPKAGGFAVLGVESVSMQCPATPLIVHLNAELARQKAKKKLAGDWRLSITQLTDEVQLESVMKKPEIQRVQLVKYGLNKDGTRRSKEFTLTIDEAGTAKKETKLQKLATGWRKEQQKDEPKLASDAEGANAIAAIVGLGVDEVEWDDGWMVVSGDSVSPTKLSPRRATELFTYGLGESRPSDMAIYHSMSDQARRLESGLKFKVQWPKFVEEA